MIGLTKYIETNIDRMLLMVADHDEKKKNDVFSVVKECKKYSNELNVQMRKDEESKGASCKDAKE